LATTPHAYSLSFRQTNCGDSPILAQIGPGVNILRFCPVIGQEVLKPEKAVL